MKTAWVWLCVFSEMDTSGKLEKYKREGRTEDGAPKGMTEAELREWHGCLSGVAQEALDEFVPEFWKERLKYFSGIAGGGAPTESETARATEDRQDPVASVQEPTDSHVDSDVPKQDRIKPRPDPAAPVTPAELWGHFSYEKTSKTSKFRDLLIYSFVRLSIPGGRTNRDVVEQIAKGSHIPVESLSDELNQPVDPGSRAIFGVAGDEFDRIADNYDNMQWWVSDAGLNMAIASPANPNPRIPTFDELAGRLFAEPAETQKRPPRGKTPIRDPRDPATEQPHTPERSSPPKPQLPLDVCVAIAEAERKIRRLLEDCHDISIPIILEPHVLEAAEVMRRHVSEAFKPRVEYYASQSGFCRAWLNEAADETISAIVGLVPFRFTRGSRYLNSVPSIKKDLREILRARIEEWLDRTNDVDKQKAGDPALDLPKLPSEAQAQLDGAKRIAQETLGHARIHLKRTAETKGRLEALGVAGGESAEQVELQGQYERHLENARRCVQLAIGEMFDAYAAKHWQAVCPDAVTFSGRLPAIAAEVESSLTCPELASTIAEALSQKRIEWADKTAREQAATAGRLEHVTKLLPIVAEFRREYAKNPNKKTDLLEKLATDVVTLHLGQLVPLVTNLAEYGQFEDKVSWARPFVNQAIRFLDDEDLKVAWSFVEAKCELLLAEAARQLRDKATPDSNARRAGSATASVGRGKGTGQLSAAGAAELAVAIDKVEAILKSHDAQAPDEHAKIRATEPCKLYDEKTALADGLRTQATVWATQALLDVAERDVMPREPDAFDRLLDRLIHRLAEEAAARFSLAGYRGFPNHHSEIRARLLEDLPKIAQDSSDVNRRRYLGDWPTRETETEAKPKTEQGMITHPSALPKSPDAPKQQAIKPQPGTERKGDAMLLADKRLVSFGTAEQYLGITDRQRQKLMNSGELKVEGKGMNWKITTESLKAYLPPDIPN